MSTFRAPSKRNEAVLSGLKWGWVQKLSYILHCGLLRSFTAASYGRTNQKTRRGNGAKANCLHPVSFCRGFGLPAGQEDDQSLQDMGLKPAPTLSARFLGTLHVNNETALAPNYLMPKAAHACLQISNWYMIASCALYQKVQSPRLAGQRMPLRSTPHAFCASYSHHTFLRHAICPSELPNISLKTSWLTSALRIPRCHIVLGTVDEAYSIRISIIIYHYLSIYLSIKTYLSIYLSI